MNIIPLTTSFATPTERATADSCVVPVHGHCVLITTSQPIEFLNPSDFTVTEDGIEKEVVDIFGGGTRWELRFGRDWIIAGSEVTVSFPGEYSIQQLSDFSVTNNSIVIERGRELAMRNRSYSVHFNMATFTILIDGSQLAPGDSDPDLFNPTGLTSANSLDNWIQTAQSFGAQSFMLTTKHVDGFCLWESTISADRCVTAATTWWNANGFDIVDAFVTKVRAAGMKVGFYFSVWDRAFELANPSPTDEAYTDFILAQLTELLTNYGPIDELCFDAWAGINTYPSYTKVNKAEVLALVASLQPNCAVLINDYNFRLLDCDVNLYEAGLGNMIDRPPLDNQYPARTWLTPTDAGTSWFDDPINRSYLSTSAMRARIAESHSRNSEVMFNLSPGPTGLIDGTRMAYVASLA